MPVGSAEICLTDVNGQVDEPLSEYHGLVVYYYPTFEHEGIRLYESPDIGTRRDPALFEPEATAAIEAIQLCRQICAARSGLTELDRHLRLAPPQPAETLGRFHRDVNGNTTLTVATTFRVSAEELTGMLLRHSSRLRADRGSAATVTIPALLDLVADHARPRDMVPHGWNPVIDWDDPVTQWAQQQVRALLPALSWK